MNNPKFKLGDLVRKTKGSQWSGVVVGTYSTELTPEGYAVESSSEKGSVQIYPAAALEGVRAEISVPISQIAGLQAVGEALSGNPKALAAVEQLIEEVGRLQKASVPVCVGRELIQILAAEGQWVSMDGHGLIAADGLFRKDPYIELEKAQAEVEELRGKLNCLEQVSVSPMENPDLDWIDAMRRDKEDRDATRTKIAGLEKEVLRLKENRPAENQVLLAQLEAQVRTIQGYRMACDEKVSEINAAQVEVERLKSEVLRLRHNAAKQDAVFDGEIASLRDSAKAADEISSHQISTIASERDRPMKQIHITMPDGSIWAVPAEIVARHRADYYAKEEGEGYRNEEYASILANHERLLDWAENNMNWKDVSKDAFRVSPGQVDYQEGWVNGAKKVVEVKP